MYSTFADSSLILPIHFDRSSSSSLCAVASTAIQAHCAEIHPNPCQHRFTARSIAGHCRSLCKVAHLAHRPTPLLYSSVGDHSQSERSACAKRECISAPLTIALGCLGLKSWYCSCLGNKYGCTVYGAVGPHQIHRWATMQGASPSDRPATYFQWPWCQAERRRNSALCPRAYRTTRSDTPWSPRALVH
jgi:hypothetical protein|eukprot:SAG25_NODE_1240_length_3521_cov_61.836061_1_plen_189_part_00